MALPSWKERVPDKIPCETDRDAWACPNMKSVEEDDDMNGEHYECSVCNRRIFLDYEDIK